MKNIFELIWSFFESEDEKENITITTKGRQFIEDNMVTCAVCKRVLPDIGFDEAGVCKDCQH